MLGYSVEDGTAEHLLDRIAEHLGHARIDESGNSVELDFTNSVVRRGNDATATFFGPFLPALAVVDVRAGAEPEHGSAFLIENRLGTNQKPEVLPVMPAQPILVFIGCRMVDRRRPSIERRTQIVRMDGVFPRPPLDLHGVDPRVVRPTPARIIQPSVRAGCPSELRNALGGLLTRIDVSCGSALSACGRAGWRRLERPWYRTVSATTFPRRRAAAVPSGYESPAGGECFFRPASR